MGYVLSTFDILILSSFPLNFFPGNFLCDRKILLFPQPCLHEGCLQSIRGLDVSGQFAGVSSHLPPCRFWVSNSGHQTSSKFLALVLF